jgi:hypothetical protein
MKTISDANWRLSLLHVKKKFKRLQTCHNKNLLHYRLQRRKEPYIYSVDLGPVDLEKGKWQ